MGWYDETEKERRMRAPRGFENAERNYEVLDKYAAQDERHKMNLRHEAMPYGRAWDEADLVWHLSSQSTGARAIHLRERWDPARADSAIAAVLLTPDEQRIVDLHLDGRDRYGEPYGDIRYAPHTADIPGWPDYGLRPVQSSEKSQRQATEAEMEHGIYFRRRW